MSTSPVRILGLREAIDRVVRDVVAVAPGEQVAAVVIGVLVATGGDAKPRCRWLWQLAQLATLAVTRAQLASDGAEALHAIGVSEADA
jgi:hypothetical protein